MTEVGEVRFAGHAVAQPLADLINREGEIEAKVVGASRTSAYLRIPEFVVAVTARPVPLMPNALSVIQGHGLDAFQVGAKAQVSATAIRSGHVVVGTAHCEKRSVRVSSNQGHTVAAVTERGCELAGLLGCRDEEPVAMFARLRPELGETGGRAGVEALLAGLRDRDPDRLAEAGDLLTGRGPGLTPDGDDLLAATAAAIVSFARAAGHSTELAAALLAPGLDRRTGALSATLLRLAAEGHVIDPVGTLLDLDRDATTVASAFNRLRRIGHGTGGTYALGCALAALELSDERKLASTPGEETL